MTRLTSIPADGWMIRIDGKDNYQLDGDVGGGSTTLTAEIQPAH